MLSKNIEKTAEIAEGFFSKILRNKREDRRATVVCLSGGLGVGKTAFTQAIAKHLGVKNKIISPTFEIIKKYSHFIHISHAKNGHRDFQIKIMKNKEK